MATSQGPVRLYSDRSHYAREHRSGLIDVLRPWWKDFPFSEAERQAMYGLTSRDFTLVADLKDADLAVLPMSWNHYWALGRIPQAIQFVESARRRGKQTLTCTTGDFGVRIPCDDVYVLRPGGYRSRQRPRDLTTPVFIPDPHQVWFASEPPSPKPKGPRPSVGFCGLARTSHLKAFKDVVKTAWRNLLFYGRLRPDEPQSLYPAALLRSRAVAQLARSPLMQCVFILRDQYRAGARTEKAQRRTSLEFYQNLRDTHYTVCIRGSGNFSQRFYETLAMGRIPVFVNTDCPLPFADRLPWRELCVWVEGHELATLPQRVADHFARTDDESFVRLQVRSREVWQEWLTFGSFHRRLACQLLAAP